jgi:hypothetical protein
MMSNFSFTIYQLPIIYHLPIFKLINVKFANNLVNGNWKLVNDHGASDE